MNYEQYLESLTPSPFEAECIDNAEKEIECIKDEYEKILKKLKDIEFTPENTQGYLIYLSNVYEELKQDYECIKLKSTWNQIKSVNDLYLDMIEWIKILYNYEFKSIEIELNRFIKTDDSTQENYKFTPQEQNLMTYYPQFEKDYPILIQNKFMEKTENGLNWLKDKASLAHYFGNLQFRAERRNWVCIEAVFSWKNEKITNLKNNFSSNGNSFNSISKDFEQLISILPHLVNKIPHLVK